MVPPPEWIVQVQISPGVPPCLAHASDPVRSWSAVELLNTLSDRHNHRCDQAFCCAVNTTLLNKNPRFSLTRKRSLVQSQYRAPSFMQVRPGFRRARPVFARGRRTSMEPRRASARGNPPVTAAAAEAYTAEEVEAVAQHHAVRHATDTSCWRQCRRHPRSSNTSHGRCSSPT